MPGLNRLQQKMQPKTESIYEIHHKTASESGLSAQNYGAI